MKQSAQTARAVIEAKLYPGAGGAKVVKRPQLLPPDTFRDGSSRLAVICAPAGYGKTTVMSCWHRLLSEQGFSCGWLSLDGDDNDAARLMRYLVAAFQRIHPELGRGALGEIVSAPFGSVKPALESLAVDLGTLGGRSVMFIDDLQFVTAPDALEIIDWLINYAPRSCQFVIGSRDAPKLRLGGLRVRCKIAEYGYRELRFSDKEVARFFELRLGQGLSSVEIGKLAARTEGWPAALELASLALNSEADRSEVIERFAGSDSDLIDYLGEVVIDRMAASMREFVLRIAHFDRISLELATAVAGDAAAVLLATLRSSNLFLVPLDRGAHWFRFHALIAEFFRDHFRRQGGNARPILLTGARFLFSQGHIEEAINAAIRAEDWETASGWIAQSVELLVYQHGYHQTILRWMKQLPEEWVDRFPTIRIHYSFALAFSSHQSEVGTQVHRLERIRESMIARPDHDAVLAAQIECEIELQKVLSLALRDDGLSARAGAEAWLERWPKAPLIRRGTVANVLTFGLKTAGELDAALALTERSRTWLQQAEGWYSLAWTEYLTALVLMKRGAYLEARRTSETGLKLLDSRLGGHPAQAAMFHAMLAMIAYEFDELDTAREHLDLCMPRVAESAHADAVLMGFLTLAKLERVQRGERAGLDVLHEGQELGERRKLQRVTVSIAAEECGWHSRAGRFGDARRVAIRYGFDRLPHKGESSNLRSGKAFLVASRYLMRRSPDEVLALIDEPIARCEDRGLFRRRVELLMLKALALRHNGKLNHAAQCLKEAMSIAAPRNYFRVLLDEAVDLHAVLDHLDLSEMRSSEAGALVRRLSQSARDALSSTTSGSMHTASMVEELSRRELVILKRINSDLSNQEIADALFISPGTLKWHLHNIYGKLYVKNRMGAVTKARSLGFV